MSLFFVLAGLCYMEKNDDSPMKYIVKKIKGIYFPYIAFTITLVLFHNLFIRLQLYASDTNFLSLEVGTKYGIIEPYSLRDTVAQILRTLLFAGNEEFGGATWFLRVLFFVSIFHCIFRFLLKKIIKKQHSLLVINWIIAFVFLIIGYVFDRFDIHLPLEMQTVFSAYFPFALGFLLKNIKEKFEKMNPSIIIIIVLSVFEGAILYFMSLFNSIGLGLNSIINPLFYCAATVLGFCFVYQLAYLICRFLEFRQNKPKSIVLNAILLVGQESISVVFWHFLAMKSVTLLYILITHKTMLYLGCFPVAVNSGLWWILYTISGIVIPILIALIWKKSRCFIKREVQNNA